MLYCNYVPKAAPQAETCGPDLCVVPRSADFVPS